jgi:hypothetical protein
MKELLFIALVLACPLMMVFMMRGHGHGGHTRGHGAGGNEHRETPTELTSTVELRRQRDELDRLIEEQEGNKETPTPAGGGRR